MTTEELPAGKLVFSEGETGDKAYRIVKGIVEISIQDNGKKLVLATIGEGEIFGEMAMIEHRPRSATARVIEATTVEVIGRDDFEAILAEGGDQLVPYLTTIFERLRVTNDRLLIALDQLNQLDPASRRRRPQEVYGLGDSPVTVLIEPDSDEMRQQSTLQGRVVRTFPYQLGRRGELAGTEAVVSNQLLIADRSPYRVSRKHCILDVHSGGAFVEDKTSRLGTYVNGIHIGGNSHESRVRLSNGSNSIVLGDAESQVRFTLNVEERVGD